MNPKNALKYASDEGAKFVSVRFTDFPAPGSSDFPDQSAFRRFI